MYIYMSLDLNIERERKKAYQREYYKKNRQYHVLYHLRKRLINGINDEIKNMISIREYAKLKKDEVTLVRRKRNRELSGFKKQTKKNEPILVYFD